MIGLFYGLVIAGMSLAMAGAGHGWNSATLSSTGVILLPLANVSRLYLHHRWGLVIAIILLVIAVLLDVWLVMETITEGMSYVERTFEAMPQLVMAWIFLWLGWQFMLLALCLIPSPRR